MLIMNSNIAYRTEDVVTKKIKIYGSYYRRRISPQGEVNYRNDPRHWGFAHPQDPCQWWYNNQKELEVNGGNPGIIASDIFYFTLTSHTISSRIGTSDDFINLGHALDFTNLIDPLYDNTYVDFSIILDIKAAKGFYSKYGQSEDKYLIIDYRYDITWDGIQDAGVFVSESNLFIDGRFLFVTDPFVCEHKNGTELISQRYNLNKLSEAFIVYDHPLRAGGAGVPPATIAYNLYIENCSVINSGQNGTGFRMTNQYNGNDLSEYETVVSSNLYHAKVRCIDHIWKYTGAQYPGLFYHDRRPNPDFAYQYYYNYNPIWEKAYIHNIDDMKYGIEYGSVDTELPTKYWIGNARKYPDILLPQENEPYTGLPSTPILGNGSINRDEIPYWETINKHYYYVPYFQEFNEAYNIIDDIILDYSTDDFYLMELHKETNISSFPLTMENNILYTINSKMYARYLELKLKCTNNVTGTIYINNYNDSSHPFANGAILSTNWLASVTNDERKTYAVKKDFSLNANEVKTILLDCMNTPIAYNGKGTINNIATVKVVYNGGGTISVESAKWKIFSSPKVLCGKSVMKPCLIVDNNTFILTNDFNNISDTGYNFYWDSSQKEQYFKLYYQSSTTNEYMDDSLYYQLYNDGYYINNNKKKFQRFGEYPRPYDGHYLKIAAYEATESVSKYKINIYPVRYRIICQYSERNTINHKTSIPYFSYGTPINVLSSISSISLYNDSNVYNGILDWDNISYDNFPTFYSSFSVNNGYLFPKIILPLRWGNAINDIGISKLGYSFFLSNDRKINATLSPSNLEGNYINQNSPGLPRNIFKRLIELGINVQPPVDLNSVLNAVNNELYYHPYIYGVVEEELEDKIHIAYNNYDSHMHLIYGNTVYRIYNNSMLYGNLNIENKEYIYDVAQVGNDYYVLKNTGDIVSEDIITVINEVLEMTEVRMALDKNYMYFAYKIEDDNTLYIKNCTIGSNELSPLIGSISDVETFDICMKVNDCYIATVRAGGIEIYSVNNDVLTYVERIEI